MNNYATIRQWLDREGFDWTLGRVVVHETEEDSSPGWSYRTSPGTIVENSDPILDHKFYVGFGGPMCPRFVAFDGVRVYFPYQYDGATGLEFVYLDPEAYLGNEACPTPYPGG
jgi:hypothetical protein